MTTNGQIEKKRSVWRWVMFAVAGGVALYVGLDALQGRMLGAMVGTTVDPRSALGERPRSLSMERRVFTLNDTLAARAYNAKKGIETPEIKLAIPKAYINIVRSEKDGWFGANIHGVGLTISSENFKPYRLEYPRVHKEVLDHLGITLVKRSERYPPKKTGIGSLRDPNALVFPSREARARYDAELLRRGFAEIDAGIGTGAEVTVEQRTEAMLSWPFRKARSLKKFEELEGCVTSPGPYPNSVRYDHSPEVLAEFETYPRKRKSCLARRHRQGAFAVVQYDDDEQVAMTMVCRDYGPKNCHAIFHWRVIWDAKLSINNRYLSRIPEFIEKLRALYDEFEAAARGQS